MTAEHANVLIVGGGPAGLSAARALALRGVDDVLVVERETHAGGIPRHSDHPGYGIRDMRRFLSGPQYAERLVQRAQAAGVQIRTSTMVTNWCGDREVEVTSPSGRTRIRGDAVILATGARERPRTARMVPGDRPSGVLTSGQLQNTVHLHHRSVGRTAVVVGSELVSWSVVMTLREAGCRTVAMTTPFDYPECPAFAATAGHLAFRVPLLRNASVVRIIGRDRVQVVRVRNHRTGATRDIECDTVVFTGDWIPDSELARAHGIAMVPASHAPLVDTALRTSAEGVFSAGNLVHPVDTADVAALDGEHVADPVVRFLAGEHWPHKGVRIQVEEPWSWIAPGFITSADDAPARDRFLLWTTQRVIRPHIVIRQDGRVIAEHRSRHSAVPGHIFRMPARHFSRVDVTGGSVSVAVREA